MKYRVTKIEDALVNEQSVLDFIKSSQKVKNNSNVLFVLKDESTGFASFDNGKTWYSGTVRVIASANGGRVQQHRLLRVQAPGNESAISYAKLLYCTKNRMSEIPSGMAVDHLDGNHMNDKLSNYELVTEKQNMARMKVLQLAKQLKASNKIITREELLKEAKRLVGSEASNAVDTVIRYSGPVNDIFIKDTSVSDMSKEKSELQEAVRGLAIAYNNLKSRPQLRKEVDDLISKVSREFLAVKDSIKDVKPNEGETQEDFITRCMSETKNEYPDEKQRIAVAFSCWNKYSK